MLPSSPPARSVLRWASGISASESSDFLQSRVTVYVRLMATLVGAMYLVGVVFIGLLTPHAWLLVHLHPSKLVHLALALLLVSGWWLLGRRPRPLWFSWAADLGFTLMICLGVGLGVALSPKGYHLELVALLLMMTALVLRAAIVPSTPQWTALIGLLCAPPIVLGALRQSVGAGPSSFLTPGLIVTTLSVWCLAATAVTAAVSRVVYGLVTQVREAMRLGQYTLGAKIGEGGMGEVYRAEHAMLRRATAVKLLLPDRVGAEGLIRFEREVQLTSQLSHPNTVAIYDYGRTPDGVFYYAMEYLDGTSLEKLVADEGPQAPARVVHVLEQVAGSLAEAHAAGLIHRDIKPSNLLLCTRGGISEFVKVIDFGLVKRVDGGDRVAVTQCDAITGTPLFMAPECVTNPDEVSASIDTYALGAVGYFLLTGRPPFEGRSVVEVCGQHMHSEPIPPSDRLGKPLPRELEALILRCLSKRPEQRPNDAELQRLLGECKSESALTRASA